MNLFQYLLTVTEKIDLYIGKAFKVLMFYKIAIIFIFILFFIYLSQTTPFDRVLIKDAFNYVYKGMEIKESSFTSFTLFRPQAIGWPIFLSFFFFIFRVENIFEAMFVARWLSIIIVCLSIIPLYIIGKKLNDIDKYNGISLLLLIAYALSPLVQFSARNVMTEPLFCFLFLWSYVFLIKKNIETREIVLASFFASLSYWVRPNGIFQLAVILALIVILNKNRFDQMVKFILIAIFVFILISIPHLYLRLQQFGSPFDYGNNSKYFIDSYSQVWSNNISVPSFADYLRSHSLHDYYEKFIENGFLAICVAITQILQPLLTFLFLCGVSLIILKQRKEAYSLILLFIVSIAGLSLIFDVFGTARHLIYLIPFLLLIATSSVSQIGLFNINISNILSALMLVYIVVTGPDVALYKNNHIHLPEIKDHWALWTAEHLDGKIAVTEGASLLKMSQHYKTPTMNREPLPFKDVSEKIYAFRPDIYNSLADAMVDFKKQNVKYVITDNVGIKSRPYLKEILNEKWQAGFERLKYFANGDRGALLYGVNIYKIHYDKFPWIKF